MIQLKNSDKTITSTNTSCKEVYIVLQLAKVDELIIVSEFDSY